MESSVLGYTTVGHDEHDVSWMVVSSANSSVICVACLVEQMEDASLSLVQRRVAVSLLVGLLREGEVGSKLADNVLLCRHIIDIITEHFFRDEHYVETAVEVCQLILECAQSEELVWYTVDKFHFQLDNSGDLALTSTYLLLIGRLLDISPVYGFHLLEKHESLLLLMLQVLIQTQDENCQCSVIYIFIHLFDDQLHSDMSSQVQSGVCQVLVTMLSDAETLDLRINLLALLKKLLKQASEECIRLLMTRSKDRKSLVMGLKKMFITKQEVLQTASAQCVMGLILASREEGIVSQILESDLAEFLFESLHTQSGHQLNSVYQCLQTLTCYDQFFTQCHAVYGVESILRSLSTVLDMKNFSLTEKGFCLLASVLSRQLPSIPLFVNVASVRQCVHLVKQGLSLSHKSVFLQALTAAQSLVRHQYTPWPSVCDVIQDMMKMASSQMSSLHKTLSHGQSGLQEIFTAFVDFITVSCRICNDNLMKTNTDEDVRLWKSVDDTVSVLVSVAETHLLPHIVSVFGGPDVSASVVNLLECFSAVTEVSREKTCFMSFILTKCGVLMQAHVVKFSLSDPDLCKIVNTFLLNIYQHLLMKSMPLLSTLPGWLLSGIPKLKLSSAGVSDLLSVVSGDEDVAWTTLVLLYFCYLHNCSCVEPSELEAVMQCFLVRYKDMSTFPPFVIRSITFLVACSSGDHMVDSGYGTGLDSLIETVKKLPTDVWFTPHPILVCWVFRNHLLAEHLGYALMEHWLPLIDLKSLTLTDQTVTGTQDSVDNHQDTRLCETEQLLEDLAHNHDFFNVLLNILIAPPPLSSIALTVTEHLVGKILRSPHSNQLIGKEILNTSNHLLHQLFLQDTSPQNYQVCYLLRVMSQLMSHRGTDTCDGFNIKAVYHVVKYVGGLSTGEDRSSIKVCLEYLLKYTLNTTIANCLSIGPILTQSKEFMLMLDHSLNCKDGDQAVSLAAWLADTAIPGLKVPHQIHISQRYLLDSMTTGSVGITPGYLRLLSASLRADSGTSGPVVFRREALLKDTPLFTGMEIRTLYFHLQQLVCQDSGDIFTCALECIRKLYKYASTVHSESLGVHLSKQSWNGLWFETLLHMSCQHGGLAPDTLSLINVLSEFAPGQQLVGTSGEMFLQTLLKSDLQKDHIDIVTHILSKCKAEIQKKVKPDLFQEVRSHLKQIQQTVL